jgi:hypothetical protein
LESDRHAGPDVVHVTIKERRRHVKTILIAFIYLVCGELLAQNRPDWSFSFQPLKGSYAIYGGGLADPVAPAKGSTNVAFSVTGPVARQMFQSMGPDLKDVCGAENGHRIRQRAEVSCSWHASEGYQCDFGFDLVTGNSIGGSTC